MGALRLCKPQPPPIQSLQISHWAFKSAHYCGNPPKAQHQKTTNIENTKNVDFQTKFANTMGDAMHKCTPTQQTQPPPHTHNKSNDEKRVCNPPNGQMCGTNRGKSTQTHPNRDCKSNGGCNAEMQPQHNQHNQPHTTRLIMKSGFATMQMGKCMAPTQAKTHKHNVKNTFPKAFCIRSL